MSNKIVKVRVRSGGLGFHRKIGELVKGDTHYLRRNEVGTQLFEILDIEYAGELRSQEEIIALYNKAMGSERKSLKALIDLKGIKNKGGK